MCPTIYFHAYINESCCTVYGRRPYEDHTVCSVCSILPSSAMTETLYTQKEIVLIDTSIKNIH